MQDQNPFNNMCYLENPFSKLLLAGKNQQAFGLTSQLAAG
jgi:hypothetical protein